MMEVKEALTLIGLLLTFSAIVIGLIQYTKGQKWKKSEFLADRMSTFFEDYDIQRALTLLDWNSNAIPLKENEIGNMSELSFDDELITKALITHDKVSGFNDQEVVIRNVFDKLLDELGYFNVFLKTKLIDEDMLYAYLKYWIKIMGDEKSGRKPSTFYESFRNYIKFYEFTDAGELIESLAKLSQKQKA